MSVRNHKTSAMPPFLGLGVVLMIFCVVLGCSVLIAIIYEVSGREHQAALQAYREEANGRDVAVRANIEKTYEQIYQHLRTISRLPTVRGIERHGKNLSAADRRTIQEIYNNLASNVSVSELYIVPESFNPAAIDKVTGKLEVPIITFDELIVGVTADDKDKSTEIKKPVIEEVETYEYAVMRDQIARLRQHYSTLDKSGVLNISALEGGEVITCDNSHYSAEKPNDADRSGMVYSVPFYDDAGKLKGMVTAVFLTDMLRNLLTEPYYALINPQLNMQIVPRNPDDALRASLPLLAQGKPNTALIHSQLLPLTLNGQTSEWKLWVGAPDRLFTQRSGYLPLVKMRNWGSGIIGVQGLFMIAAILFFRRRQWLAMTTLTTDNKGLESELAAQLKAINRVQPLIEMTLDGIILKANDKFLALTGYEQSELQGQHHKILVSPDDAASLDYVRFWDRLCEGEYHMAEFKRFAKDGREIWIQGSYNPVMDAAGRPYKIVKYATDITARKQAGAVIEHERDKLQSVVAEQIKDLVEQKDQAEQANQAKSEFLSNMSHELRTPMHAILSYAALGLKRLEQGDTTLMRKYLTNINSSGDRLLLLLNNLLDLSKMEAGKMNYNFVSGRFSDVINRTLAECAPLLDYKGIRIVNQSAGVADNVRYDSLRIMQVIVNLLSNAIKFSPEKGIITLQLTEARLASGAEAVCLSVSDSGGGIPPAELDAVFDKFVQSSKTKSGAGGTGLGLSICREIVLAHGGTIWAENRPEGGAVFYFTVAKHWVEPSE